jgi:hypothetical protein
MLLVTDDKPTYRFLTGERLARWAFLYIKRVERDAVDVLRDDDSVSIRFAIIGSRAIFHIKRGHALRQCCYGLDY